MTNNQNQQSLQHLWQIIDTVENFPIPGVSFKDISPLLASPKAFQELVDQLIILCADRLQEIDTFAGIESRGFILASAMAVKANKGLTLIRKAGKLPPPVEQQSYQLEYGSATLEMKPGRGKLILVDDVLATGGTINAALTLCQKAGYQVLDAVFCINLPGLNNWTFQQQAAKALFHV